jgi:hypothetical protein
MSTPETDVIKYFQDRFDDSQKELRWDWTVAWSLALVRRLVAYALKAIAIFGGIAIASGLVGETTSHILGVMIAAAVGLDTLLQNFNRLIAIQDATYAYRELFYRVVREHIQKLGEVQIFRANHDEETARKLLVQILQSLIVVIHAGQTNIENAWKIADLTALRSLTMEQSQTSNQ